MRDVHAQPPPAGALGLHRVGVSGVRKPIAVQRPDRVVTLAAEFAVHVDLPADRKGSDLSRNAQLLTELVDQTVTRPVPSLEAACREIARELLGRHAYARQAHVAASAEYFLPRGIAKEHQAFEEYTILADAEAVRADGPEPMAIRWGIGAEAVGMTACPCAMETCRALLEEEYPLLRDPRLESLPIVSHNQRNRTRLAFEVDAPVDIEVDAIIEAIESAQSSPTYAILKRGDEAKVVLRAQRNRKFVEDVLRDLLADVPRRFPQLPDSTVIRAETRSEESIHKYDVTAAHRARFAELRAPTAG